MIDDTNMVAERAEAIRLLYVCMTRAIFRLYLIGAVGSFEKYKELHPDPKLDTDIIGASSYLDLMLPSVFNATKDFALVNTYPGDGEATASSTKQIKNPDSPFEINQQPADSEELNFIKKRFTYVYPHKAAESIRSKYTVTQLTEEKQGKVFFYSSESKSEESEYAGLSSAEKGTLFHKALELLDFSEAYKHRDKKEFFKTFAELLLTGKNTDDVVEDQLTDTIHRIANSEICLRASKAEFIQKELPFNMKAKQESGEEIIIQGIIDCLIKDEDGYHVFDYKTGVFDPENPKERARIIDQYGTQLFYYAEAARLIYGQKPVSTGIYMTGTGTLISMPKV